LYWIHQDK